MGFRLSGGYGYNLRVVSDTGHGVFGFLGPKIPDWSPKGADDTQIFGRHPIRKDVFGFWCAVEGPWAHLGSKMEPRPKTYPGPEVGFWVWDALEGPWGHLGPLKWCQSQKPTPARKSVFGFGVALEGPWAHLGFLNAPKPKTGPIRSQQASQPASKPASSPTSQPALVIHANPM